MKEQIILLKKKHVQKIRPIMERKWKEKNYPYCLIKWYKKELKEKQIEVWRIEYVQNLFRRRRSKVIKVILSKN